MNDYLTWKEKNISNFSETSVNSLYNQGYLFTRKGRGVINQTRSVRVDLKKFTLTSENRRVLRKTEDIGLKTYDLPIDNYHWSIGKMAKDFYDTKFGAGIFSANKVKELLTTEDSNFNRLLVFFVIPMAMGIQKSNAMDSRFRGNDKTDVGYAICLETSELLHYSYPFYVLRPTSYTLNPNTGLGMMLRAIIYAKEAGKKYIYLGSAKDEKSKYKLQFEGLEWFDGKEWKRNVEELKNILK